MKQIATNEIPGNPVGAVDGEPSNETSVRASQSSHPPSPTQDTTGPSSIFGPSSSPNPLQHKDLSKRYEAPPKGSKPVQTLLHVP